MEVEEADSRALALLELARSDPEVWARRFATIKNDFAEEVVGPEPTKVQREMYAYYRECQAQGVPCKMLVYKSRRMGASTGAQAIFYHHGQRNPGVTGKLMGNKDETANEVFEIFGRMARGDMFPWDDEDGAERRRVEETAGVVRFGKGSVFKNLSARGEEPGRGGAVQMANLTECAHYPETGDPVGAFLQSAKAALTSPVGLLIADSTPNGPKGWFYKMVMLALKAERAGTRKPGDWKLIFVPWWEGHDSTKAFGSEEERARFAADLRPDEREELEKHDRGRGVITLEHLNWRRMMIESFLEGEVNKFRQEYPSDPREGFLLSSRNRFDLTRLEAMKTAALAGRVESVGNFSVQDDGRVSWLPDAAGLTRIFEGPKYGCRYWVSFDTMTGEDQTMTGTKADPDWHDIQVWRGEYYDEALGAERVRKLVCRHVSRLPIDLAATEAYGMSVYYGGAPVVVEKNNSGLAAIVTLRALGANLWKRKRLNPSTNNVEEQIGWDTNAQTRKTIIDGLAKAVRQGDIEIPDVEVIEQMMVFVTNASGKPEAMPGEHDDAVLAAAIAEATKECAAEREMPKRGRWTAQKLRRDPGLGTSDGFVRARFAGRR